MSFFRYPGGKSKFSNKIIKLLTEQKKDSLQYREPFFGGGSIGLKFLSNNPDIEYAWINDKDVGIACLWSAVINYHQQLKNFVRGFIPSTDLFYQFKTDLTKYHRMPKCSSDVILTGFSKLAIHQMSYSGLGTKAGGPIGGIKQTSKYKIDCRWSPDYICKKIDKFHEQFNQLNVYNHCCTWYDFINLIEDTEYKSLIYLDPPYYIKGNDLYQCGFTIEDHEQLASLLKHTKHNWVLSYDDCSEIRNLYQWANIEWIPANYTITALKDKQTGQRLSRIKTELLIYPK